MVGGVVPDDMNDALVGVARFDLGQKLHRTWFCRKFVAELSVGLRWT
jgi:hypothetical protein